MTIDSVSLLIFESNEVTFLELRFWFEISSNKNFDKISNNFSLHQFLILSKKKQNNFF